MGMRARPTRDKGAIHERSAPEAAVPSKAQVSAKAAVSTETAVSTATAATGISAQAGSSIDAWIRQLFHAPELLDMGHLQRERDGNLGLGWLYYALARIVRHRTIVVVGSWRGFAPLVLAKGLADNDESGEVVFIDPSMVDDFWSDPDRVHRYFENLGVTNVRHYRATTEQFVGTDAYHRMSDVGLVFIDGHHSYDQVRFDFDAFEEKLTPDGVVLLHDSARIGVSVMYGVERAYAYEVKFFVDDLRCRGDLSVFEIPLEPGLALVSKRKVAQSTDAQVGAWLREGAALFNRGRNADAAACFDRVVAIAPDYGNGWILKGWALHAAGAFDRAVECFERARRLGHPQAERALAVCRVEPRSASS
jgi:predicted O-methyltransferase YrrM